MSNMMFLLCAGLETEGLADVDIRRYHSIVLPWLRASATRPERYLGGIPRIDNRTTLQGLALWTGCRPPRNSLGVLRSDAPAPLTSDEDAPLGICPSTAT